MKVVVIQIGKTDMKSIQTALEDYYARIRKMMPLEIITIPDLKNRGSIPVEKQKIIEAERVKQQIRDGDYAILLDEKGEMKNSKQFAELIQSQMISGYRRLLFIIGGPWGLHQDLLPKAGLVLSLSRMTYSHQLVRLLFAEQIYRALTIINGIPYHNE